MRKVVLRLHRENVEGSEAENVRAQRLRRCTEVKQNTVK
jgi:hypothetical protein